MVGARTSPFFLDRRRSHHASDTSGQLEWIYGMDEPFPEIVQDDQNSSRIFAYDRGRQPYVHHLLRMIIHQSPPLAWIESSLFLQVPLTHKLMIHLGGTRSSVFRLLDPHPAEP